MPHLKEVPVAEARLYISEDMYAKGNGEGTRNLQGPPELPPPLCTQSVQALK